MSSALLKAWSLALWTCTRTLSGDQQIIYSRACKNISIPTLQAHPQKVHSRPVCRAVPAGSAHGHPGRRLHLPAGGLLRGERHPHPVVLLLPGEVKPVQRVCEDDILQTIAIGWVYGVSKFASNVEQMTGMLPNRYWRVTWAGVAPAVMGVIFLFYCVRVGYWCIYLASSLYHLQFTSIPQNPVGASEVWNSGVSSVGPCCWIHHLCLFHDVDTWICYLLSIQDTGLIQRGKNISIDVA